MSVILVCSCSKEFIYNKHLNNESECLDCFLKDNTKCKDRRGRLCKDMTCKKCYEKSFCTSKKIAYWSSKNKVNPRHIFKSSHAERIFDCPECRHELSLAPHDITAGTWCSYCTSKKLCDDLDCAFCKEKSFASSDKAKYWSNKNEDSPRDVFKTSAKHRLFDCPECGHEFPAILNDIKWGHWCSYCANQKLCSNLECDYCAKKSFLYSSKVIYWSNKNKENPRDVFKSSEHKYIFDCPDCPHEFTISLKSITSQGHWCLYCSNQKLCDNLDCVYCKEKSFASSDKAKYWSNKNKDTPRDVFRASNKCREFDCSKCKGSFSISLSEISAGSWCSLCRNKTEAKLKEYLDSIFDDNIHQFKANWCKNINTNRYFPFDFCIKNLKIIIELDGEQHFEDVPGWYSSKEKVSDRDVYKMKMARENDYSIIRLVQEEVFKDKYDWSKALLDAIERCKNAPGIYMISINNDIYSCHHGKLKLQVEDKNIERVNVIC